MLKPSTLAGVVCLVTLTACGGGSGGSPGDPSPPPGSGLIGPAGGVLALEGTATVTVPVGAFPAAQFVAILKTREPEAASDFESTTSLFRPGLRFTYEVRVNTGDRPPLVALEATLALPVGFQQAMGPGEAPDAFVQFFETEGMATLDSFRPVGSTWDPTLETVTLPLPPEAFTDARSADDSFEALISIASTPGAPIATSSLRSATVAASAATACEASSLGLPLDMTYAEIKGLVTPGRDYNPPKHHGIDIPTASAGANVKAMAKGKIEKIGWDARPLKKPDPRSGKLVKGWGRYVIIRHDDGSATLYAHLASTSTDHLVEGVTEVGRGDVFAEADNSGGSSGSHLHLEYAPSGSIFNKKGLASALPCLDPSAAGSITVADNGSAADDAFSLSLDGVALGATSIGASNNFVVNNLRSGDHQLTLTAIVAPDDVGTYEVSLSQGLQFADGSTTTSGVLAEGSNIAFTIRVP